MTGDGRGNREDRDHGVARGGQRKFGEIEGRGLAKICHRLFDGFALGGRAGLRIEGDKAAFFRGGKHSSEFYEFGSRTALSLGRVVRSNVI